MCISMCTQRRRVQSFISNSQWWERTTSQNAMWTPSWMVAFPWHEQIWIGASLAHIMETLVLTWLPEEWTLSKYLWKHHATAHLPVRQLSFLIRPTSPVICESMPKWFLCWNVFRKLQFPRSFRNGRAIFPLVTCLFLFEALILWIKAILTFKTRELERRDALISAICFL